jgi:hypothetical protein
MKLFLRLLTSSFVALAPLAAFAQTYSKTIVVYTDDFRGYRGELRVARCNYVYLVGSAISDFKSVTASQGMKVITFERDNFEGTSLVHRWP